MGFLELFNQHLLFWQILIVVFGSILIRNLSFTNLYHVEMNQKRTKILSTLSNVFLFLIVSITICLLTLLTLSEAIEKISINEMKEQRQTLYGYLLFLFIYSMYFAMLLSSIWLKKRKYFILELISKEGGEMHFKLLKRLNCNGIDNLIYEDDDGKIYEKAVENIKSREGRLTFIPKYKGIFDISTNNFKEFEVLPIICRRIIYTILLLLSIYILWQSALSLITLWSISVEIPLTEFKLLMTFPSLLFILYIILGGYKLYGLWFGRNKIPYKR